MVPGADVPVFIDPDIAVGYEYELTSAGNAFTSVLLPTIGDGQYTIDVWNGSEWVAAGSATSASAFSFGAYAGLTRFRVNGIEVSAGLDPTDETAFVTGLTFAQAGAVSVSQTPLTVTVAVPEPESYALALAGLGIVGWMGRRRRIM